jgi:hypothetical protein
MTRLIVDNWKAKYGFFVERKYVSQQILYNIYTTVFVFNRLIRKTAV